MGRWRIGAVVLGVLLVVAAVFWLRSRGRESTDDAQVDGRITQIAARVGGTVIKVSVDNNQAVGADAVLVQIDPRDYQIAVDRARAELADAQATAMAASTDVPIARIETGAGMTTASGGLQSAQAGVSEAELEKLHGVGPKALRVIRAALEEQGGSRTKEGAWSAVDSALNPTEGDT